jgi:hypothetical protein
LPKVDEKTAHKLIRYVRSGRIGHIGSASVSRPRPAIEPAPPGPTTQKFHITRSDMSDTAVSDVWHPRVSIRYVRSGRIGHPGFLHVDPICPIRPDDTYRIDVCRAHPAPRQRHRGPAGCASNPWGKPLAAPATISHTVICR